MTFEEARDTAPEYGEARDAHLYRAGMLAVAEIANSCNEGSCLADRCGDCREKRIRAAAEEVGR